MAGLVNRDIENGEASNKWLLLVVSCGILVGLAVFRLSAEQRQRKELASRLNQALLEKEALNSQVKDVQGILEPLRQEVDLLRNSLGSHKKDEPAAKKEIVKSLPEAEPQGKAPRAKGRGSDIEQRLANIKNYKKGIEEQNALFKDKIEEMASALQKKEDALLQLKDDNRLLKEELAKAAKAQGELQERLILNLSDSEGLKKQLAAKSELEGKATDLNNRFQLLKETNSAIEKQLLEYRQEKAVLEQELNKSRQEMQSQASGSAALNKKISELTDILTNKESEKLALSRELEGLRQSKKDLEAKIQEMSLSKNASSGEILQLNARITELNSSSETMKNTVNQLSGLLSKKEEESAAAKAEIFSLRDEMSKLTLARDTLASALNEKEKSIISLNDKLSRMESQAISLQAEAASAKENYQKTAEQLARMKSLNSSLRDKFLNISRALEPVYMESDSEGQQDKIKADELRKKVEVELDLEK